MLTSSSPPRIVIVSSEVHAIPGFPWDDLNCSNEGRVRSRQEVRRDRKAESALGVSTREKVGWEGGTCV